MISTSKMYKNQPGPSIKGPGLFILNILLIHQYNQEIAVIIIRGSTVALAADDGRLQVTVQKSPQIPIAGIKVYLFDNSGSYLGLNQVTDMSGIVGFSLSEGSYSEFLLVGNTWQWHVGQ